MQFTLPEQSDWCDNMPICSYDYIVGGEGGGISTIAPRPHSVHCLQCEILYCMLAVWPGNKDIPVLLYTF